MRAIETGLASRIAEQDANETPAAIPPGGSSRCCFSWAFSTGPRIASFCRWCSARPPRTSRPAAADVETAKIDPIPIKRRLNALDEELHSGGTPEWRRQQIEQLQLPLAATHRAVIEARRRVLVRRLFAGMHDVIGDEAKIADALTQLADQGLVSRTSRAGIDCHPLVRGYFGARLKELDGEIFRAAHGRLYDHYRYAGLPAGFRDPVAYALLAEIATLPHIEDQIARVAQQKQWPDSWKASFSPNLVTAPWDKVQKAAALIGGAEWDKALKAFLPDGEAGMTPLFSAVAHGCAAEREAETWSEVYLPRIARGNENFALAKLGLYGQQLAALASFFDTPFTKPSRRLAGRVRASAEPSGLQLARNRPCGGRHRAYARGCFASRRAERLGERGGRDGRA